MLKHLFMNISMQSEQKVKESINKYHNKYKVFDSTVSIKNKVN